MLSAYLYRIRKQALKKPVILVLEIIAVAFCVLMLFYPTLMSFDEEVVVHNNDLIIGGLNLLTIIIMNFMFYSGLSNGAVGFTNADVNFHLAGPFSPKFNLVIAAAGVFKIAAIFMWVFCCQVAVIYMTFGVSTVDMFGIVLSAGVTILISYALGAFFSTHFDQNKKAKIVTGVIVAVVQFGFVVAGLFTVLNKYGSVSAVRALGFKGIISALGSTLAIKAFPIAGWISLVYTGILIKDILYILIGIALVIASFAAIATLFNKFEINYYETALISAQKVADMKEAQKAGIDSDSAKLNQKIKVGKETFNKGWGSSAFFHRHLLENKRASKFFFINPLALFYRLFVFGYMFLVKFDDPIPTMVSGFIMIFMLNAVVFGGGKTVLEFNRPYIFMVPEKGSKKVMSCLLASIPEMVFDSLLCALCMMYFAKFSVFETITSCVMFLVFDIMCQLIGILSVRYLRSLGRVLLMVVRYFIIFGISLVALIPGIVVGILMKSFGVAFLIIAAVGLIISGVLLIPTSKAVDNVDLS